MITFEDSFVFHDHLLYILLKTNMIFISTTSFPFWPLIHVFALRAGWGYVCELKGYHKDHT